MEDLDSTHSWSLVHKATMESNFVQLSPQQHLGREVSFRSVPMAVSRFLSPAPCLVSPCNCLV